MKRFPCAVVGLLMLILVLFGADAQAFQSADTTTATPPSPSADTIVTVVQPDRSAARPDTVVVFPSTSDFINTLKATEPSVSWSISVGKVFWSIVTLSFAFLFIKYLSLFLDRLAERWANIRLTIKNFIPIVRIVSWTLALYIVIVNILAPPIQTLIAFTASAGIAIGFAAQDILKNIFGGIVILFDRPFQVGDKIEAGGYYGEVRQIGLRSVRIVTPDDSLVSIPNGELMHASVSNANAGEPNCQVVAEFFLPADIDLERTKRIAYRAAAVSKYAYLNKPIDVVIKNEIHQGRSLLKLRLKAYVIDIRHEFAFMTEMTEIVTQNLFKAGILTPEQMTHFTTAIKQEPIL